MATKKQRVIVSLDKDTFDKLIKACEHYNSSKSDIVVAAIIEFYMRWFIYYDFDDCLPPGLKKLGCK